MPLLFHKQEAGDVEPQAQGTLRLLKPGMLFTGALVYLGRSFQEGIAPFAALPPTLFITRVTARSSTCQEKLACQAGEVLARSRRCEKKLTCKAGGVISRSRMHRVKLDCKAGGGIVYS